MAGVQVVLNQVTGTPEGDGSNGGSSGSSESSGGNSDGGSLLVRFAR